jgi:hypothetical protein
MWYEVSASRGNNIGTENRDKIAGKMSRQQIKQAQDLTQICITYQHCSKQPLPPDLEAIRRIFDELRGILRNN